MRFALSTNWCNRRIESGEEIADMASSLGFDELELGFNTTALQVKGFKSRLDRMPVGSVHAFCPVPISAPCGYPELYQLAARDENERAIARIHVKRNVEFAAEMGATALVLHAGRVPATGWLFGGPTLARRTKRGKKAVETLKRELDGLRPVLEKHRVTLGLENLPYLEGFPAEWELKDVCGDLVAPWFDTGHNHVRRVRGWAKEFPADLQPVGLHINDSKGGDDHLAPGEGDVDFASLKPLASAAKHLVFEPHSGLDETSLFAGLEFIRELWA